DEIDPYSLRDIAYESTLAKHLDLACNSVGANWWPDRHGAVRVARVLSPHPVAHYADDDRDRSYTSLARSRDTRNVVNDLSVTNRGRTPTGETDDQTTAHRNQISIATLGRRGGNVDLSLYDTYGFAGSV